jgi:hypothetical protein
MPLKTPSSSKSNGKPAGKVVTPTGRGASKSKAAQSKKKAAPPPEPEPVALLSFWDKLSAERKLDVVGAGMAIFGLVTVLVLLSAQRSAPMESVIRVLGQTFGWGIYILPIGLIGMGLWLILRRIEKLPPLSLERATGLFVLFFWLLAIFHFIVADVARAQEAALNSDGGGYFGSFFERILLNNFGAGGSIVILLAWFLIATSMILDISVSDLFKWVKPVVAKIWQWLPSRK